MSNKPLSDLIATGWTVVSYAATMSEVGYTEHCFHLQKGRENKILRVRKKMIGEGVVAEELDI